MSDKEFPGQKALGFAEGGVLRSRSVVLPELTALLPVAPRDTDLDTFQAQVVDHDPLHMASTANRVNTFGFPRNLCGLRPDLPRVQATLRIVACGSACTAGSVGPCARCVDEGGGGVVTVAVDFWPSAYIS
jgi:hypothetical protein